MLSKYLLPPDVFIRHWLVANEIKKTGLDQKVLDVGGSLGEMRKFLPGVKIVTTDVVPGADILYDGKKLPFKKGEYAFVVSIDTLEHIPSGRRLDLIGQMTDIAKRKLILIAPFASIQHEKYEKKLVEKYNLIKSAVPSYLLEHRKYGLVTTAQLNDVSSKYPSAICSLVGMVWLDRLNFSVHMFEVKAGKINRFIYYLKFVWNIILNLLSPWIIFNQNKVSASRALIIIEKL
ncbi:MAG: hypothetical protein AAB856_01135 [Patescibacteria group bacterium]